MSDGLTWGDRRVSVTNAEALETIASYTSAQGDAVETSSKREPPNELVQQIGVTPSADPELWQAIMASLEEQDKSHQHQLTRHLSDAAPELAGRVRQQRHEARRVSPEGVTYFEDGPGSSDGSSGGGSGGSGTEEQEGGEGGGVASGLVLPSFADYPPAVRAAVLAQLCNSYLQQEAEQEGVINAVPGCTQLLVLTTLGDGNCLSHACSLGTWGIHDRDALLRSAVLATMSHPAAGAAIRQRFLRQLARNGIPQEDWEAEWQRELRSLADSSTYLSDVHVYTLASVLRRPIVLFADQQAAAAGLSGIYLPSLWGGPAASCSRQPLCMLFGWSHFSLLVFVQGEGPASPPLLPLCTRGGPLQLRFLSEQEEQQVEGDGGELGLLRQYMDAERLYNGGLGVRLSVRPRPHVLAELLSSVYLRQVAERHQQEEQPAEEA